MMYALVDMTGGLGELIRISNKADVPENLYEFLRRSFQMNSLLGASIHVSLYMQSVIKCLGSSINIIVTTYFSAIDARFCI